MARILPAGIFLEPADVASFADALVALLADARARGEPIPERAERVVPMLDTVATAYRRSLQGSQVPPGTQEFRPVEPVGSEGVEWISVAEAAKELGTSEENVRKRCRNGSLSGVKEDAWKVDRASLRRLRSA